MFKTWYYCIFCHDRIHKGWWRER